MSNRKKIIRSGGFKGVKRRSSMEQALQIRSEALSIAEAANSQVAPIRQVTQAAALEVVWRALNETRFYQFSTRRDHALTELCKFIEVAQGHLDYNTIKKHSDLLNIAHPYSAAPHAMTASARNHAQMQWFMADPIVTEETAPLLASAFAPETDEITRTYALTRLTASAEGLRALEAITAAFSGDGNSYFARRMRAMRQRRDRLGRFAEEGGGMRALLRLADGSVHWLTGRSVGADPESNTFDVETPRGIVRVPAGSAEGIEAYLPGQEGPDGVSPAPAKITSADASDIINEADLKVVDAPSGWESVPNFKGNQGEVAFTDGTYTVAQLKGEDGKNAYRLIDENGTEISQGDSWAKMLDDSMTDALGTTDRPELPEDMLLSGLDEIAKNDTAAGLSETAGQIADYLRTGNTPEGMSSAELAKRSKEIAKAIKKGSFGEKFKGFEDDFTRAADAIKKKDKGSNAKQQRKEEKAKPVAELPAESGPVSVPAGMHEVDRGEYIPQGYDGQESPDFTDDPAQLARKFRTPDLQAALREGIVDGSGEAALEFSEGEEYLPVEALYHALKQQQGGNSAGADKFVDSIYRGTDKEPAKAILPEDTGDEDIIDLPEVPDLPEEDFPLDEDVTEGDLADAFVKAIDMPEVSEVEPLDGDSLINEDHDKSDDLEDGTDEEVPALIDSLSDEEKQAWIDGGYDHTPFLPANEEIELPDGYHQMDPAPLPLDEISTVEEGDELNQVGVPVGWTDDPYYMARDYNTEDLIDSLLYALEPRDEDSPHYAGHAPFSVTNEDGEEIDVEIKAEVIRDALQLQGEDTNEIIQRFADEAFASLADDGEIAPDVQDGQSSGDLSDEEMRKMMEGEGIPSEDKLTVPVGKKPPVTKSIMDRLAEMEPGGGMTIDPIDGTEPDTGIVVAHPGHNKEFNYDEFMGPNGKKYLKQYIKDNRDLISQEGNYLGLWHDEDNNEMVLDVVEVFNDRDEAIQAGIDRNQQAIYDIGNNELIDTGGTGDRQAEQQENIPSESPEEPKGNDGRTDSGVGGQPSRETGGEQEQKTVAGPPAWVEPETPMGPIKVGLDEVYPDSLVNPEEWLDAADIPAGSHDWRVESFDTFQDEDGIGIDAVLTGTDADGKGIIRRGGYLLSNDGYTIYPESQETAKFVESKKVVNPTPTADKYIEDVSIQPGKDGSGKAYEDITFTPSDTRQTIPFDTVAWDDTKGEKVYSSGESQIIDFGGRKIVVMDINGTKVPFYLSTGNGGKKDVAAGKWYPFFGVSKDGWLNKTGGSDINNYYDSPELKAQAEWLDANIGDIRDDNTIPKVKGTGSHMDFINQDLNPAENSTPTTISDVTKNIENTKEKITKSSPTSEEPKPTADGSTDEELSRLAEENAPENWNTFYGDNFPDIEDAQAAEDNLVVAPKTPRKLSIGKRPARTLQPGDVTVGDNFTIVEVGTDINEDDQIVIKGYFPGHPVQEKLWRHFAKINVVRGLDTENLPKAGDLPELHKPTEEEFADQGGKLGDAFKLAYAKWRGALNAARARWTNAPAGAQEAFNPDTDPHIIAVHGEFIRPGDILADRGHFVVQRVFTDEKTEDGKVSVEGYYPGHVTQRKEWKKRQPNGPMEVIRNSELPEQGPLPEFHQPFIINARGNWQPDRNDVEGQKAYNKAIAEAAARYDMPSDLPVVEFNEDTAGLPSVPQDDSTYVPEMPKYPPFVPSDPFVQGLAADLLKAANGDWGKFAESLKGRELIFFDYETTGLMRDDTNNPVQIGAVKVVDGQVVDRFNVFMNPERNLEGWSLDNLKDENGNPLTDEYLQQQISMKDAHEQFAQWAGENGILIAHNSSFDREVLERVTAREGVSYNPAGYMDTVAMARAIHKDDPNKPRNNQLPTLAEHYGSPLGDGWHAADADAEAVAGIFKGLLDNAVENGYGKSLFDVDKNIEDNAKAMENYDNNLLPEYKRRVAEALAYQAVQDAMNGKEVSVDDLIKTVDDIKPMNDPASVNVASDAKPIDFTVVRNSMFPDGRMRLATMEWALDDANARDTEYKELQVKDLLPGDFMYNKAGDKLFQVISVTDQGRDDRKAVIRRVDLTDGTAHDFPQHYGVRLDKVRRPISRGCLVGGDNGDGNLTDVIKIDDPSVTNAPTHIEHNDLPGSTFTATSSIKPDDNGSLVGECLVSDNEGDVVASQTNTGSSIDDLVSKGQEFYKNTVDELKKLIEEAKQAFGIDQQPKEQNVPDVLKRNMPPISKQQEVFTDADGNSYVLSIVENTNPETGEVSYESAIAGLKPDGSDWDWTNAKISKSDNMTDLVKSLDKFKKDNGPKSSPKPSKKPIKSKEQKTKESRNIPEDAFLVEETKDDGSTSKHWETPDGDTHPFDANDPEQVKRDSLGQVFGDPSRRILTSDSEVNDAASMIYIDPEQLDAYDIDSGEVKVQQPGQKVNDRRLLPGGQVDIATVDHPDGHKLEIEIDRAANYEGEPDIYRVIVRRHDGEDKLQVLADSFSDTNDALARYNELVEMAKDGRLAVKSDTPEITTDPSKIIVTENDADVKRAVAGGKLEYLRVIGGENKEYQKWSNENFIYASGEHQARLGDRVEIFWDDAKLRALGEGTIVDWKVVHNANDKSRKGYAVVVFRDGSHGLYSTDMLILKGRGKGFEGSEKYNPPVAAPRPKLDKKRKRQYALRNRYELRRNMRGADGKAVKDENGKVVVQNVLYPYVADAPKRRTFKEDVILTAKALKLQRERGERIRVYHEESGLNPDIPFEIRPPGGDNRETRIWQAAVDLLDGKPFMDEPNPNNPVPPAGPAAPAAPAYPERGALFTAEDLKAFHSDISKMLAEKGLGDSTIEVDSKFTEYAGEAPDFHVQSRTIITLPNLNMITIEADRNGFDVVDSQTGEAVVSTNNAKSAIAAVSRLADRYNKTPEAPKTPEALTPEQVRNKDFHDYVKGLTEEPDYENDYKFKGYTVDGARLFIYDKANSNQVKISWDEFAQGWQVDFTGPLSGNNEVFGDLNEAGEHALSFLDEFRKDNPNYGEKLDSSTDDVIPPDPTDPSSVNPAGPNFNLGPAPEAPVVADDEPTGNEIAFNAARAAELYTAGTILSQKHKQEFLDASSDVRSVFKFYQKIYDSVYNIEKYFDMENASYLEKALKEAESALVWLDNDPGLYAISDNFNADLEKLVKNLRDYAGRTEPSESINVDEVILEKELLNLGLDLDVIEQGKAMSHAIEAFRLIGAPDSVDRNKKIRELLAKLNRDESQNLVENQRQELSRIISKFDELHPVTDEIPSDEPNEIVKQRIADNVNAVTIPEGLVDRFNNIDPEVKDEISKFMEDGSPKALANLSKRARTVISTHIELKLSDEQDSLDKAERLELFKLYLALKQERLGQNPTPTSLGNGDFLRGVDPQDVIDAAYSNNRKLMIDGKYTGYTVKRSEQGGGRGGDNMTYFVKNEKTGETFVFKYEGDEKSAFNEALATNVINAFGVEGVSFVAPHEYDPNYIVMSFAGANLNLQNVSLGENYDEEQHYMSDADILQSFLIGMFDAVSYNEDRHDQNYLVGLDETGTHVSIPIDHGLVFPYGLDADHYFYHPESYFYRQSNMLATPMIQNMINNWGKEAVDELVQLSTQQAYQALKRMYPAGQEPNIDVLLKRIARLQTRGID